MRPHNTWRNQRSEETDVRTIKGGKRKLCRLRTKNKLSRGLREEKEKNNTRERRLGGEKKKKQASFPRKKKKKRSQREGGEKLLALPTNYNREGEKKY